MNRKRPSLERPKINMTPMIDVVFLLLTFFVMTFKIIIPEGDFHIEMAPQGEAQPAIADPDSVQVRLFAHEDGSLAAIQLDGEPIEHFALLRQRVSGLCEKNTGLTVVLFPDEHLTYLHVIEAITAVNGEFQEGNIRKICGNIKFVRQKESIR